MSGQTERKPEKPLLIMGKAPSLEGAWKANFRARRNPLRLRQLEEEQAWKEFERDQPSWIDDYTGERKRRT